VIVIILGAFYKEFLSNKNKEGNFRAFVTLF